MEEATRNTIIVNAFGGPGAGKTTAAWGIASELKKLGLVVEYVPEYAKELVWDERMDLLDGSIENQLILSSVMKQRVDRLIGKVDIIVTDSPLLMSGVYLNEKISDEERKDFQDLVFNTWNSYNNFNFFVKRNSNPRAFEKEGRIHSLEESKKVDDGIRGLLAEREIYYGIYEQTQLNQIAKNIKVHFEKSIGEKSIASSKVDTEQATERQIGYAKGIAKALKKEPPSSDVKSVKKFITDNHREYQHKMRLKTR